MANPRVAVLASGEGTTAIAVIKTWLKNPAAPRVNLVISNNPDAGVHRRLIELNKDHETTVEFTVINGKSHPDEQAAILDKLEAGNFDLIWLAGYMKKIGPKIVERFGWRDGYDSPYQAMMLNAHPGLLPATKGLIGLQVQEFVLANPGQKAGHTLHVVSDAYDEGPTISEHQVEIHSDDTAEALFERVKASERKHLPADIENFIIERRKYLNER